MQPLAGASERTGGEHRRALVVVKDTQSAQILREVLIEEGFEVSRAANFEVAIELLGRCPFDLVVAEHAGAASLDATRLALQIRRDRNCPSRRTWLLVFSRVLSAQELWRLRDAGVSAVLTAPFTLDRVRALVHRMDRDIRAFIDTPTYVGPDRRVRSGFYPPEADRRTTARAAKESTAPPPAEATARN